MGTRIATAAVLSLVVFGTGRAKAQDDPVEATRTAISGVGDFLNQGRPGKARAQLALAQSKLDALGEFEREKVANDLAYARRRLEETTASWTSSNVQRLIDDSLETVAVRVQSVASNGGDGPRYYDEARVLLDAQLADEVNRPLITKEQAAKIARRLEWLEGEYAKNLVKAAIDQWESSEKYAGDRGWEQEPVGAAHEASSWNGLGCEKSQKFAENARAWLESDLVRLAQAKKPGDAALTKLVDELAKKAAQARAKVEDSAKAVLADAEKLPPGEQRRDMHTYYQRLLDRYTRRAGSSRGRPRRKGDDATPPEPFPAGADVLARIEKLVARWDEELGVAKQQQADLAEKNAQSAATAWPEMLATLKPARLAAAEALGESSTWKGRVVRVAGRDLAGGAYEASSFVVVEIDGVPVCGDLDEELARSFHDATDPGDFEECVGVVEGVCRVWQRVRDSRSNRVVRGAQIDGVRARIVGLKCSRFAGAVGMGTAEAHATSESGFARFLHRLVAWGMSILLVIGAGLSIERLPRELGDHRAHAGIGLAFAGTVWCGAALVSPVLLSECRFGSLPALVLLSTGIYLAVARSGSRALALGCLAASLVHVLFWDKPLL